MTNQPGPDAESLARALCVDAHRGQTRFDGTAYSTHPIAVAEILKRHGIDDPVTIAAAYLHDVLEDTEISKEELSRRFGADVTRVVEELTNRGWPGRTFEEKHRALAEHARHMSVPAKRIKLADRWHNLSQMDSREPAWQKQYAIATVELLEALKPWPIPGLAAEILAKIRPFTTPNP